MSAARQSIISRLRANQEVDDWADLCIYPSGSLFVVEFLPPTGPFDTAGLTKDQQTQLAEDGELNEYFETPEEAADLYLLLEARCQGRLLGKKAAFSDEPTTPRKAKPVRRGAALATIDEETFETEVSESKEPVVVLFWSPWSASDRMVLPIVNKVAGVSEGIRFFSLDVEEVPTVPRGLKVTETPTCLIFRGGLLHARIAPPLTEAGLLAGLASLPEEE